jgi:hypothetical protein
VNTASREANARQNKRREPRSDSIGTEKALNRSGPFAKILDLAGTLTRLSIIGQPLQRSAKTQASGADQAGAECLGVVSGKGPGKPAGDFPAAG